MASMGNAQRGALGGLAKLGEGARTTSDLSRVGGGLSRGANEGKKLNAAPWSDTFPAAGATLDLDFANNRGFVRGVGQGGVMDAITFTRASNGNYVNEDGLLVGGGTGNQTSANLLSFPQDFDNAAWVKSQTSVIPKAEIAPDNTLSSFVLIETTSNSIHYTYQPITVVRQSIYTSSVYIKNKDRQYARLSYVTSTSNNGIYADFDLVNGVIINQGAVGTGVLSSANIVDAGNGWYRCQVTGSQDTATNAFFVVTLRDDTDNHTTEAQQAYSGDGESCIFIWGAQLEVGSTATEYFPTNIGEPRFDWASTDSTGAGTIADPSVIPLRANPTSNGILIEEARTNRLLWNRDATQTEWAKTNITATKDQTGIDGVANAASSLTATDANGTCIQTITLAAGNRTGSVYLKRLTGTGLIQVTLDGSTYSTVELSDTEWYRIVLSGSVTNPTVGIKIVVDGDAVAMDYGQVEDGLFVTTPILTTTATATRAVEIGAVLTDKFGANSSGYNQATFIGKFTPVYSGATPNGNFCGVSMRDSVGNGNLNNMVIQNNGNGNLQFLTTGGGVGAPVSALSSPSGTLSMGVSFKGGVRSFAAKGTQGTFSRTDTYAGSSILLNSVVFGRLNYGATAATTTINRLIFISKYNTNEAIEQIVNTL
jgi:hypothetical protein